ncbi:hypothetical protein HK101_009125 [Irineochytrium annulatum]|nr:hypothetical protein HK101_009125 [Irineochytrium annulatum]
MARSETCQPKLMSSAHSFESVRTTSTSAETLVGSTPPPSPAAKPSAASNPWRRSSVDTATLKKGLAAHAAMALTETGTRKTGERKRTLVERFMAFYNNSKRGGDRPNTPITEERIPIPATTMTRSMSTASMPKAAPAVAVAVAVVEPPAVPPASDAANHTVTARVVADASGLARIISNGLEPEEQAMVQPVKFEGIDFDAYWAYFAEDLSYPEVMDNWDYSSAKMVCFAEGWSWWLRILSWEQTPRTNLMDMIHHLLDCYESQVPIDAVPPIHELSTTFTCTYKPVVSVGVCIRSDVVPTITCPSFLDADVATKNEMRFWGVIANHPVLDRLVRTSGRYELLEKYYGATLGTFMARRAMSYRVPKVSGDGWFAMGIAAGFTSPLFSPGINMLATPMGVKAAKLTKRHLESGDTAVWEEYDAFVNQGQIPGLRNVDLLLYNMFRDPRFFMSCFPIYYANGIGALKRYVEQFQDAELNWANGSNEQTFKDWTAEIFPLICGPSNVPITPETAAAVDAICEKYRALLVDKFHEWTKYSRHLRCYGDDLKPAPGKTQRLEGEFMSKRCRVCQHAQDFWSKKCVLCGSAGEAMEAKWGVKGEGCAV